MTNSNPEVDGGGEPGPFLRQEARKALSGRVPLAMSIALALLSGMLVGYGVRALTDGHCPRRERCSRQAARVLVVPKPSEEQHECKPRLRLLQEPAPVPGAGDPTLGRDVEDAATNGDAARRKTQRDKARAIRDAEAGRAAPAVKSH